MLLPLKIQIFKIPNQNVQIVFEVTNLIPITSTIIQVNFIEYISSVALKIKKKKSLCINLVDFLFLFYIYNI